ncbi:hypothetical protein [Nostoc sp. 'Peltigera membranacea cyanobiont' 232]|uniref:hypothetical protein n=1 Tax=Nostoc sp. 'Peltigera membranacea cyanobiont' 232 TaxID=2014531 RepID=UPI001CB9068E|nr:hypothetical protein [Nostoc sp. 'Peltigera membranacea cyanobiont' 232]
MPTYGGQLLETLRERLRTMEISVGDRFFVSRKVAAKRSPTPNLLYLYYVKVIKFSMITNTNTQMKTNQYPFAEELITDTQGNIRKVIIDFQDYLRLLEVIEDEGLILAIKEVQQETPLNINEALAELERE